MTREERLALRAAIIAGPTDCALDQEEAAVFLGMSISSLRTLDVPRANVAGPTYLKSQLLLYVKLRMTHLLVDNAA